MKVEDRVVVVKGFTVFNTQKGDNVTLTPGSLGTVREIRGVVMFIEWDRLPKMQFPSRLDTSGIKPVAG
jgi:hypothetical protein